MKNDITIFTETTFGNILHRAFDLYDQGKYSEAKEDWEEVIARVSAVIQLLISDLARPLLITMNI